MKYLVKARDYQNEALMANRLARADGTTKVTNVLASGLGKTLLAAFDIREYLSESKLARPRILILNGNIQLLKQIEHEFREKAFGHEYSYGVFNGAEKTSHITDFLFATFDSMYAHLDEFNADEFAYVFIDEAHHAQAMTYSKVIQHFRPERMLAVTATPLRMDGKDITELCGPIVYSLELEEAIARGLTAGVDYHLCLDEIEKIQLYLESGEPVSWNKLNSEIFVPKRDEEIITTVQRGVADLKDPTTIYFCRSIRHANRIAKLLPDSTVVHSHLSEKEVARRLKKFRCGEAKTIVAVDMLNEGIDIPRTDVVVFLRSTRSWTVFLQQLGRGLRLTEGKGAVRVYDFVGTATALEKIITLEKRVNDCARENGIEEKPNFELKINAVKFHISKVDIVQLLSRITERSHRTFMTDEEILNGIKRLADMLGRIPTTAEVNDCEFLPSMSLIVHRFGSMERVLAMAGLDANYTRSKKDTEILAELKRLADSLGRAPTVSEVENCNSLPCYSTLRRRFGSWGNMLALIGLKSNHAIRYFTDDEILDGLRRLKISLGRAPTKKEVNECPWLPGAGTISDRFGTFNNSLIQAKITPHIKRGKNIKMPEKEMLEGLRKLADELGRTPTEREVRACPWLPSANTYISRFGSFNNAIEEAGLRPSRRRTKSQK